MISRDSFAKGFRLAWRWCPVSVAVVIGSFIAIAALGYFWEQVEIANAVQRGVQ